MTLNDARLFSIIIPTRGRPDGLRRVLDSFKATTSHLNSLEIILVIDSDDAVTLELDYDEFAVKRVVVEPGLKMGALNMAGYKSSTAQYVMLLNDDVIVRTPGWDENVLAAFRSFADGIVLVHVNDKIFEDKLCTFPFLSRTYCELAGGICPRDYVRYRIDDHIYNVFNLLSVMGKNRILYLPDMVFEHTNHVRTASGGVEYRPDERIHEIDTTRFQELLPERKQLALKLLAHIDEENTRDKLRIRQNLLEPIVDSVALRRPEYVRELCDGKFLSSANTRVTIGIVSANLRSDHARTCIDLVKKFTSNFDLVILDNNGRSNFNHPREMNKLLSTCDTDYLVLMDDDVFVEAGWLDGMLRCITPSVGVVTPLHKDRDSRLSYAGVVMRPDYSGHHSHSFTVSDGPRRIQTLCSAILLIDMGKCGHIRFNESYAKYFLDIDYGLRVWSAGYDVICSPDSMVTHIGGATLQQGSPISNELFESQRQYFVREWIDTGRYRALEQGRWETVPEISSLLKVPTEIESLIKPQLLVEGDVFRSCALSIFRSLRNYPAIADWAVQRVWEAVGSERPTVDDPEWGHLGFLLGCIPNAVLIEQNVDGLNIVLYNADYYAIPQTEGGLDYSRVLQGNYSRCFQAESVDVLKARIRGDVRGCEFSTSRIETSLGGPILLEQNVEALNIVLFNDEYYAIPQADGAFDIDRFTREEYSRSYRAKSLNDLKAHIRDDSSTKVWRKLKSERARSGSWQSAVKSVVKTIGKRTIILVFGIDVFRRIKGVYLQVREERRKHEAWLPALMFGIGLALHKGVRFFWVKSSLQWVALTNSDESAVGNRRVVAVNADPQRWLNGSPITLVEEDYRGYAIYRFEYKFFGVMRRAHSFSYEDFQRGNYNPHLIGHSLSEVHASIEQLLSSKETSRSSRVLVFACLPAMRLKPLLDRTYLPKSTTLLVDKPSKAWGDYQTISLGGETIGNWARTQDSSAVGSIDQRLVDENFDRIVIPWIFPESWVDNSFETAASRLSDCVEVLHGSGQTRLYRGEDLHRLIYNKAYLASMFEVVPSPVGKTVLEAGCSDGLVCDIFSMSGASKVVGIDVMKTVGCGFNSDGIEYHVMDIASMSFPDKSFDITYSIATFEHLANPYKALQEMLRVTKVGGHCYVQAGPLYHSPFGHHMFGYFQDYPWVHLRKSKEDIIALAKERGVDKVIERDLGIPCEQYVFGMITVDHVNGLLLEDYRLNEFGERDDIEVLKLNISHEGEDLLTSEIAAEIPGVDRENLTEHGFEIAFRRTK
jgi:GT2 family glycosyltransferase/SAM-dependent methyltransferase